MRKLFPFLMLFGLLVFTACDSDSNSDDGPSDSEQMVGTWAVVGLTDATGDRSGGLVESYNSVLITMGANGSVNMAVDAVIPQASISADGTYSVTESSKTLSVVLSVGGQDTPLSFTYEFANETTLQLTPSSTTTLLLGVLFQTSYADPVLFTFSKVG
jgi:hypothetical protein